MTRLRGRSLGGTRCHDSAPGGSWTTITMISSMRLSGATECMVMPGATNSISFKEYVRHFLAPSLKQGDTVVMDNLAAHKDRESMELIEARGARVKFLPPYSPDLNPIEMMWSKVKEFLRNVKARTTDELIHAIKEALGSVTVENIASWVSKSGYVIM